MKILAAECSAKSASCAIMQDGKIIASDFIINSLTHSQTLMPMIKSMLNNTKTNIMDIDGFCISAGPGSFTGVRIGISAIKGMAAPCKTACVGVSTLEAIAYNYINTDCIVCAVMDARCSQVYNALFEIKNGTVLRLCDDRALMIQELSDELNTKYNDKKIIIVGDGTDVFSPFISGENIVLSAPDKRYQSAVGVALCAAKEFNSGNTIAPDKLLPIYLRLPQAERELKAKQKGKL